MDTLLSAIRVLNNRTGLAGNPSFDCFVGSSFISIRSGSADTAELADLVIGPGLPSRKDSLISSRAPLITVEGAATVSLLNIYIRGKTRITSAGMGVTNNLPNANAGHYGSAAVTTPWTWDQTFHTFIGSLPNSVQPINLRFGSSRAFDTNAAIPGALSYYQDGSGKLLPNHIHLLTSAGAVPSDNDAGPFFDQFIHAPLSLSVQGSWQAAGEAQAVTTLPRIQGFVGKFGSNGHSATKTRGVLGGNADVVAPETGFSLSLTGIPDAAGGRSIFQRAGIAVGAAASTARVTFDASSTAPGDGFPTGLNPVITSDTSGAAALNVGLRSYLRGISTANAITIPATNVIL